MHRAGHRRQGPWVAVISALALLPGCGATTTEEAQRLQSLAQRLAPLAPPGAHGEAWRRLQAQVGPEAAASLAAVVAAPAGPVGAPELPASAEAPPATLALGASGPAAPAEVASGAPGLTSPLRWAELGLGLPSSSGGRSLALVGADAPGDLWRALGRSAEALLDAKGYVSRRPGAIATGQSLRLSDWRSPSLHLKLAGGAGQLRLVWATEGALPEEHALGSKLLSGPEGLELHLPLGALAAKPGRLIMVARGEGGQALRVEALRIEEAPQPLTPSLGQLASR